MVMSGIMCCHRCGFTIWYSKLLPFCGNIDCQNDDDVGISGEYEQ